MRKTSRILFILACSVAITILGIFLIRNLVDFPVYYAAGRSVVLGRTDLYSPDFALGRVMDYRYPPFFLIAFLPVWLIPYSLAAYIWYLLSVIEVIGCAAIIGRTFPKIRESKVMWLVVALAVSQYFVMALHYGNAHLLAVFLLFATFHFIIQQRNFVAAALMSLAITVKLTPILILPYFALKKQWTLLAGVFVWLIVINLIPSVYFGFRTNGELLGTWYRHVVASQNFHEENGPINLSLKGQLRRYFSMVDYSQRVDGDVQYTAVNVTSLSREQVGAAWTVLAAGLFSGFLLLIWWKAQRWRSSYAGVQRYDSESNRSDLCLSVELALMICLTLLVGPLTSKIYFIALLWPLACLASFAVDPNTREGKLARHVVIVAALVNSVLPLLPGRSVQRLLLVLGVDFYVNCLLMSALIYVLVYRRRSLQKPSGEPQMRCLSGAKVP
jgi:hypothetical protein